jgi:hypothetical protein
MSAIASLIDFLMGLMRDEKTRLEFERDPEAGLADRGLENVTGQDVRDARLMMADDGMARPRAGAARQERGGDDDVVREIRNTTNNFEVNTTVVAVDDRDTTVIVDSFNSDTDVVAIQDNDVIDNSTETDVDVISIEDNDTTVPATESGEAAPEPGAATEPAVGTEPGTEPGAGAEQETEAEPGFEAEPGLEAGIDPVLAAPADEPFDVAPETLDPVVG